MVPSLRRRRVENYVKCWNTLRADMATTWSVMTSVNAAKAEKTYRMTHAAIKASVAILRC